MVTASVDSVLARIKPYTDALGAEATVLANDMGTTKAGTAIDVMFGDKIEGASRDQIWDSMAFSAAFRDSIDGVGILAGHRAKGFWDSSGTHPGVTEVHVGSVTSMVNEDVAKMLGKLPDIKAIAQEDGVGVTVVADTETAYRDMVALLKPKLNGRPLMIYGPEQGFGDTATRTVSIRRP
jgi:hypothetical protein